LRYGIPNVEARDKVTLAKGNLRPVWLFTLLWDERRVILVSDSTGNYPVEAWTGKLEVEDIGQPIFPFFDYVSFPVLKKDGLRPTSWDIGFIVGIPARQLNQQTLEGKRLKLALAVSSIIDSSVVFQAADSADLGILLARLEVVEDPSNELRHAMWYFNCPKLPAGSYSAEILVIGGENNSGSCHLEFSLPSSRVFGEASDPVFLFQDLPEGSISGGINRPDRDIYCLPGVFRGGETTYPRVEFWVPKAGQYTLVVTVSSTFRKETKKKGEASVSSIEEIKEVDSGEFWKEGDWAAIYKQDSLSLEKNRKELKKRWEKYRRNQVFTEEYELEGPSWVAIELDPLPFWKIRGEYWASFSLSNLERSYFVSSGTKVSIK
jgi:hypothetical protein